jgi:hypothetical protein
LKLLTYLGLDVLVAGVEVTEMPLEGVDLVEREVPLVERLHAFHDIEQPAARLRRFVPEKKAGLYLTYPNRQYVRGDVTTNTVEGYYPIFKRGMKGIYQHCAEKHLHRYLSEIDFRYSNRVALGVNDVARAERVLKGVKGKRLTYRTTN